MTPRNRLLATIRHEPVDRIPTAVICIENQPEIATYLGGPEAKVMERLGIDSRVVAAPYAGALWPAMLQGATECRPPTPWPSLKPRKTTAVPAGTPPDFP